jgi:hypothetical protein
MQNLAMKNLKTWRMGRQAGMYSVRRWLVVVAVIGTAFAASPGFGADNSDPLLDLLLKKGLITEEEAGKVKTEADALRTNAAVMPSGESKWKLSDTIKSVELFGDLRLRFEDREVHDPAGGKIDLQRGRYAVRLGLRGDAFDDFYYGFRLDTAANPRSPWVTFGTSSPGTPPNYNGPFGKSTAGINIGLVYLGWRPEPWLDITVGKMPMPLYTTPMVWDNDLNPEGAVERFKYSVGQADFFATFGQFLYADFNPDSVSGNLLGLNSPAGQSNTVFMLAWQGGLNYHFTTNVSAKVAATLYHYIGTVPNTGLGDTYVGEGAYTGPGGTLNVANGASGYNNSSFQSNPAYPSLYYPNNQTALDHLLVLEIPFEVNFKIDKLNARFFGDFAYNFEGSQRAELAQEGYASFLSLNNSKITPFAPQRDDVKAYQIGFGIGNGGQVYGPAQGLVYGTTAKKNTWEFRTYWQHVEQYALDANLLDSDFFEGRGNLEGIYVAAAYGFSGNVIGTVRYGYANRINQLLGTGGSNQDIPQVNPIDHYNLLQLDMTFRF